MHMQTLLRRPNAPQTCWEYRAGKGLFPGAAAGSRRQPAMGAAPLSLSGKGGSEALIKDSSP